jgi:chemotaxis protein methyltransferase CheR
MTPRLAPDAIVAIAGRLAERAGLALPAWVVDARATARIAALGCTADDYVALIDSARGAGELAELIEAVRVGESRLFRHRSQIDALASVVAPALRARGRRTIRAWSAGCAAGEEPYTLAIVLSRALPDCAISILATDVSADALARARTASYPSAAIQHVPAQYRDAFRDDGGGRVSVIPELVALVRFERANLLDGPVPHGCDLVWCRNVLIYFTADARRRAIDRLVGATAPGGCVFVGYSESLRDVAALDAVRTDDAVYYVRRAADAPRPRPPIAPVDRTPSPVFDRAGDLAPPPAPTPVPAARRDRLVLSGRPSAAELISKISTALAQPDLEELTIDLDGVELLDDELVRVLRRARAAAWTAQIELDLRATRAGVVRWLDRHGFGEPEAVAPLERRPVRRS